MGYIGRTKKNDKKGEDLKDWAVAGRNLGWLVIGLAWSATYFSSYAVLGVSGQAYSQGLAVLNIATAYFVPTGVIMYILGGGINVLGRRNGYISVGDLIEDRFETKWARLPIVITTLIFSSYYAGIQLIGAGYVLEQLAGIDYRIAVGLGSAVLCLYVAMGGFKSTALTDTLQAFLLFLALFGGGAMAIYLTKGSLFSMLIDKEGVSAITSPGLKGIATPAFGVSYSVNIIIYTFGYMFMQWLFAAENPTALRRGAAMYSIICPAGYIFGSTLLGLAGLAMGLKVANVDHIFPVIVVQFFGPLMGAVLVSGVLGATQSTAASVLAGVSLCSSYDLYQKLINPNAPPRRILVISRILSFIILVASIALAIMAKDAILFLGAIGIAFFSVTAPVIICCLFWPRSTKQAAIIAPAIGMAVLLYTIFIKPNFMGLHPGFWVFTSGLASFIIISYATPPSNPATIERIHGTICKVYHKELRSLWFPTRPGNILCASLLVFQVFAICYGLKIITSTKLIMGMAPQFAWVVMWWIISIICMFYLFRHTVIDEKI
jgi:SSS family solute:Na+ symporter